MQRLPGLHRAVADDGLRCASDCDVHEPRLDVVPGKADGVCGSQCVDPASDPDCPRDCAQNNICATQACARPDVDCVDMGNFCDGAFQCQGRLCVTDPQHPRAYCSKTCAGDADCPSTMACAAGTCQLAQHPVRQLFDSCSASTEFCAQGICTGPASGISRCVTSCLVTGNCPSGSVCEAGSDSRRFCRPDGLRFNIVTLPAAQATVGAKAGCSATGVGLSWWLLAAPLLRRRRVLVADSVV